ncbi:unnamed protein product [Ranitomeya imitator]|uniref:Tc1-like transposase DDE domain-containing protein n=2 Tax=Ranitomeya imitator TaxID=111125 RepID=A0ABN9LGC1_9NEOB|nr:unnamed protein product [Ranitomeya imitator]
MTISRSATSGCLAQPDIQTQQSLLMTTGDNLVSCGHLHCNSHNPLTVRTCLVTGNNPGCHVHGSSRGQLSHRKNCSGHELPAVSQDEGMFKMDYHAPTIKPRRIQNQNVIHRLERRKISSGKPGSHWHQVRIFHQNVFPNYTVVNVEKPPCFLRKFSPDGRYFIAFSSDQTSLEIYEYQGCQAAEDLLNGYEGEILANSNDQRSVNIRGRLFERFFVLLHITNVASNGEHLNRECSLFTDDCRYVIVGSAAYLPEEPYPPFHEIYRNSESVTPNPRSPLEDYSLHIIDLHTGRLCDTRTFKCDKIILSHNQGLYLYKNILAILSVQQQTIHVFQVTTEGTFIDVRTIGRFCYEDDLLILSAVYPEVQRETQTGMANLYNEPFINSLKHRLLVYLWRRAERDGSATAKRRFFQYFDQLRQLRMWKMQLLDESHLFIKYTSEDVVTLRVNDPSQGFEPQSPINHYILPATILFIMWSVFYISICKPKLGVEQSGNTYYPAEVTWAYLTHDLIMDNDPKHKAKATQEFIKAKKWNIIEWPSQSPDLNPIERAFHLLKTKLQTESTNKQQLKTTAVMAWQSIKKEETQRLVMSMSSRLQAVIANKGFSTKN